MTCSEHETPEPGGGSAIFERLEADGCEQVLFSCDRETGLRSLIIIHDTTLGPALGAVRMWPYGCEAAALDDGIQLAQAMTLKAAAAGLDLGGGASIIIGDPARDKSEELLRAHGRFIAGIGGRFTAVNDIGTTQSDMAVIGLEGAPVCDTGDPSPYTALGVIEGIKACLRTIGGDGTLAGVRVAIQGVGNVGAALARMLAAQFAEVVIADLDARRAQDLAASLNVRVVDPTDLLATECDVFAPCALGPMVTAETLPELRCQVIAGGANNVLADPTLADALAARGILYAPDFCLNAGGLIYLAGQLAGDTTERIEHRVRLVGELVTSVLERARLHGVPTTRAAVEIAEERLRSRQRKRDRGLHG